MAKRQASSTDYSKTRINSQDVNTLCLSYSLPIAAAKSAGLTSTTSLGGFRRPHNSTCRWRSWESRKRDLVATLLPVLRLTPKIPGVVDRFRETFPRKEVTAHLISALRMYAPEPEVAEMSGIRRWISLKWLQR
ncbi:hypothetical protein EVAR_11520_1 [Eumeta japonica]|uniref:Uncharacterized protein n=1 Tax=Eumeta variegata TaxID=151549 RepID=A0A4C1TZ43_EUMVA|nr:hypothetical protein EVAR_11520_1 [Eumeta japonica]